MASTIFWDGLKPDDPLVRYMRLSAFLSLVKGHLFIPSLETLQQSSDPTEGLLSTTSISFPLALAKFTATPTKDMGQWLFPEEIKSIENLHGEARNGQPNSIVVRLAEQIARTRAVLSFYARREENMAMWQIYARDGVAIETSPASLEAIDLPCHSVPHLARVRYHNVGDDLEKDAIPLLARPYLFKLKCYEFEQEVRWAMVKLPEGQGIMVQVNPREFVKRVRFSPFMHPSEANVIADLCRPLLDTTDICQSATRRIDPPNP